MTIKIRIENSGLKWFMKVNLYLCIDLLSRATSVFSCKQA